MATTTKGIYYPNDGTKAADVLTDLKQMAESIDETIGKEVSDNKYDDTEIKQDISDIKKEQETQNADIEKINQNVDTLEEQIPVSENKGEVIKLIDSSNMNAVKFNIFGNQIQDGTPTEQNPIAIQTVNQKINLTVSNENLAVMNGIGTDVELTENGIKIINTERINYLSTFKIKKGQTIKVGIKMLTAVTGNTSITCYVNGESNDDLKSVYMKDCKINEVQERSYTATEDCEINFSLSGNTNDEMSEFQLWANLDKLGEYTVAKNQTLSVDVQQEMLSGDTFKNENGNWKEIHNWQKILSYNGESITTEYISSTGALTTGATVYYRLTTPTELNCTQTQIEQLNTLVNISTYKNVTYIYSTDTVSPIFEITYRKDLATLEEKYENKNTEQDELISKLQEDSQKLKNALLNAETEEAKSLYVEDANRFGSLEVLGNHEQETSTQGKNYFTGNKIASGTAFGVTYSFDNSILKANGTSTVPGSIVLDADTGVKLPAGTYTYTVKKVAGDYTRQNGQDFALYLKNDSDWITGDYATSGITGSNLQNNSGIYSRQITITEETEIYFRFLVSGANIVFNNLELEIQIESGSEYTEFEQFVPNMPSPDYPSPVKCLGSNKNVLNDEIFKNVKIENSASISGLGNVDIELKNTTYRTRIYFADGTYVTDNNLVLYAYNSSNQNLFVLSNTKSIQVTNAEEVKYVKLVTNTVGVETYLNKIVAGIKVEEGTEVTSYSPYGQGSTKISKINKNWFDNDNLKQIAGTANFEVLENGIKIIGPNSAPTQSCVFRLFNIANYKGETFTIKAKWTPSANNSGRTILGICNEDGTERKNGNFLDISGGHTSYTIPNDLGDSEYLAVWFYASVETSNAGDYVIYEEIQIELGDTATDYVEHEQTDYILDIQQEMLSEDYFVKEADGWKEVHNWTKIDSYNSESITTDYISTTGELTTGATIYYKLATPTKLACTEAQSAVLEELSNLDLFGGVNNIITAEDIALLKLKYALDVKTYVNNLIASQAKTEEA